ncbi:hypothetical protein NL108_013160 [Boleophthalmus pectinirostris]|uniref:programmed cell death 1 ligand 1-like n=1 Tax=Boleophthalmus pectinirostris TaxID=150288 RepID=UPI002432FF83|nr:programmed cell death 1 ligand 1-like [Boleophthalmus pectinirostris]KAJ0063886.1 hypothetical protein NL108_013160 [Boleophthalmus pectinirostris]
MRSRARSHLLLLLWASALVTSTPPPEPLEVSLWKSVVLPCFAPPGTNLQDVVLEWTREDLENNNVFLFRDGRPYLVYQHGQFKDRVELKDPSFKNGNLSMTLKDASHEDSGRYRCTVFSSSHVKKRSVYNTPPVKVIDLKVVDPEPERIRALPGQDVVLKMEPVDYPVTSIMWKRPEDEEHFVFLHGMGHPHHQHPQYDGRVQLKNQDQNQDQIQDLSVVLHRAQPGDSGEYHGYIVQSQHRMKRDTHQSKPAKVIILDVLASGACRFEAGVGFVAAVFISLILHFFK